MWHIFVPSVDVVLDGSTTGWHGEDEKRPGGPPALTHFPAKPEPVCFVINNIADVVTGIIFKLEFREGNSAMLHKPFSRDLKSTSAVVSRLITLIV